MSRNSNREPFNENSNFIQDAITQEYFKEKKFWEYIDLFKTSTQSKPKKFTGKKEDSRSDKEKALEWLERNIASCHSVKRIYEERIKAGENIKESRKALAETIRDLQVLENVLSEIKKI